jgi:predicted ribosome quality control (RQC) complex YloA/Tae2 family protein
VHNNYYFLRKLSARLAEILTGAVVSECYSQQKDELIVRFETKAGSFYIKATLSPALSCLSFPEDHQRSRKNNIDLFPSLIGLHVMSVRQFENERSFAFVMTDDFTMLFKMHGNRSNLILFSGNNVVDAFRKNIPTDQETNLKALDREIDFSYDAFLAHRDQLQSHYFTFGKPVWTYLEGTGFTKQPAEAQWETILETKKLLESTDTYRITSEGSIALTLLPADTAMEVYHDPVKAATSFYYRYAQQHAFIGELTARQSAIRSKIASSESFIRKNEVKLMEITRDDHYKVWADLIMANLHQLRQGQDKVVLDNFYDDNKPIEIKLKQDLSPQKNAEIFYRKAKNQHIEITTLRTSIEEKRKTIALLREQLTRLTEAGDLKTIRQLSGAPDQPVDRKKDLTLPYHEFEFKGYRIWVGKDAVRNDELTLKYGFKEDLWLHAKDVPGSHVLIKHQAGKPFPKDVIERAAQLAAYNSKRKTESLCPVVVTPKKFVRKRKGDPAGMVVVEKENVIMVVPTL